MIECCWDIELIETEANADGEGDLAIDTDCAVAADLFEEIDE
jgi:hypothetical protein